MKDNDFQLLKKRLAMFERKAIREKKAREIAEKQLDDFSWEIFQTNSSLRQSLDDSQEKARELDFLHEISTRISEVRSIDALIKELIVVFSSFTRAQFAFSLSIENGKFLTEDSLEYYVNSSGWLKSFQYSNEIVRAIEKCRFGSDKWTKINSIAAETLNFKCLFLPITTSDSKIAVIVLLSEQEFIDEGKMLVLETAKSHLLTGIRRRINSAKLKQRAVELESVLTSLENTQRQLIQSEKMASLGQLAAGVAHEINNPVGFIRSNLQVLDEYIDGFAEFINALQNSRNGDASLQPNIDSLIRKNDIEYICNDSKQIIESNLQGINRVSEIVQSLKNFSYSGEQKQDDVSLFEVIDSSLKVVHNQLKYKHLVSNTVQADLPKIKGNFGQLQQVLVNFFVNAAQAMPTGGTLSIASSFTKHKVILTISDNGIGMSDEVIKNMFTPFYTTKAVGEGTGLGMSISYAILESHHAQIDVESKLGHGSKFTLTFQRVKAVAD